MRIAWATPFLILICASTIASSPARAQSPEARPEFCAMLDAFDRALQRRFYNANFASTGLDCSFLDPEGCVFATPDEIVIRVTHVRDLGCDAAGDCRFQARQVCEADRGALLSCHTLMYDFEASYIVTGDYAPRAGGTGWRLENWRRAPAPALTARQFEVELVCPAS